LSSNAAAIKTIGIIICVFFIASLRLLERHEANRVFPIFRRAAHNYNFKFVNGFLQRQPARGDNHAGHRFASGQQFPDVMRHGAAVMREQNAPFDSGLTQQFRVGQSA
jgi:hypothetical protein